MMDFWVPEGRPFGRGSSWSTVPSAAWSPGYRFGACVARPARCGGICSGECAPEHEVEAVVLAALDELVVAGLDALVQLVEAFVELVDRRSRR